MLPRGFRIAAMAGAVSVLAACSFSPSPAPPAPAAPPTVTPPAPASPATARDATQWPFATNSPWNTPLGSGATYQSSPFITGCCPWLNYDAYSIPIYQASASDPLVTITARSGTNPGPTTVRIPSNAQPAVGTDRHMVVITPDHSGTDEWWDLDLGARTAGTYIHADLQGSGFGIGWVRATGVSLMGGLIRPAEVLAGKIPHVLAFAAPGGTTGTACPIWPATTCDAGGEGALIAIPPGTPKPAGLSTLGSAIFDTLQQYGAYNVDQTGGGTDAFYVEPTGSSVQAQVDAARSDMATIMPLMRIVTNNGPSSVGGPGTRLAPLAPAQ